ncbi:uncharacterized protein LOC143246877 [Tachypleus tridentatus]|uniref:uncharacterized protein LOC143246877 n=1 Tax=Tachypleus tridentatus TaxID=6853 RepID=UPI003FD5CD5C
MSEVQANVYNFNVKPSGNANKSTEIISLGETLNSPLMLHEKLQQLKMWQEKQQGKLREMQKQQWQKLNEEQKRIRGMLTPNINSTRSVSDFKLDSQKEANDLGITEVVSSVACKSNEHVKDKPKSVENIKRKTYRKFSEHKLDKDPDNETTDLVVQLNNKGSQDLVQNNLINKNVSQYSPVSDSVNKVMKYSEMLEEEGKPRNAFMTTEEMPVNPGIVGGIKTFEDLLKHHLHEETNNSRRRVEKPKKPFLQKGAGLAKYQRHQQKTSAGVLGLVRKKKNAEHLIKKDSFSNSKPRLITKLKLHPLSSEGMHSLVPGINSEDSEILTPNSEYNFEIEDDHRFCDSEESMKKPEEHDCSTPLRSVKFKYDSDCNSDFSDDCTEKSSFSRKIEYVEVKQKKEMEELAEFEILEQVTHNTSLNSESSVYQEIVNKPLQQSSPSAKQTEKRIGLKSTKTSSSVHFVDFEDSNNSQEISDINDLQKSGSPGTDITVLLRKLKERKKYLEDKFGMLNSSYHNSSEVESDDENVGGDHTLVDKETEPVNNVIIHLAPNNHKVDCFQGQDFLREMGEEGTPESNILLSEHDALSNNEQRGKKYVDESAEAPVSFQDDKTWKCDDEETKMVGDSIEEHVSDVISDDGHSVINGACSNNTEHSNNENKSQKNPYEKPNVNSKQLCESCRNEGDSTVFVSRQLLRDKLQELEDEIQVFQKENAKLNLLRKQREEQIRVLEREKIKFDIFREEEKQKMQKESVEEKRKLKRERDAFEHYQRVKKDFPERKEREEIRELKTRVKQLEKEVKQQEKKWSAVKSSLRAQLRSVERERDSLRDEVGCLENDKLELLAKLKMYDKKKKQPRWLSFEKQRETKKNVLLESKPKDSVFKNSSAKTKSHQIKEMHFEELESSSESSPISSEPSVVDFDNENHCESVKDMIHDESKICTAVISLHSKDDNSQENIENNLKKLDTLDLQKSKGKVRFCLKPEICVSETGSSDEPYVEEIPHHDRIERVLPSGEKEIVFASGTVKHISADGKTVTVKFYNGDKKEILDDHSVVYHYAESGIKQTSHPDGLEIIEFPGGQIEKHYSDGMKNITFPDGAVRIIYPEGSEENWTPDGTIVKLSTDGIETLHFPNGQKEIHTPDYKKREYPDGTVKIVYADGHQETRYSSGRLRIKDKNGKILIDEKFNKDFINMADPLQP